MSVTFSPIRDSANQIVGISGISRDITQLVRARQEIAEREERIRPLLDSTAEAIYVIHLSGVCIFCDAACARLPGYESLAALIGRQMHPLIHHTKADDTPCTPEQSPISEARRVRENSAHAGVRLVALSGYGQDADIQASLAAGFDEHLTKPADPARLEALLENE